MNRQRIISVLVVALVAGVGPVQPAEAAGCGPGSSPTTGLVREAHPVVLAHGWTGGVMRETRTALEKRLPRGWQFLLFDYHDASASWASSPRIAGCFATYLKAVSDAHVKAGGDGLVYVVAHSMGGLALRFAVDPRFGKVPDLGERIGGLVTLATPHRGTPWGDSGVYVQLPNLKNALLLDAAPKGQEATRCLALHDAGTGLPAGCDPPPYLPTKIRVDQIAGVATVRRSFFGIHAYDILLGGDSIVPQASAQGYLRSAPGSTAGMSTRSTQVSCAVDSDAFGAVLGGGVLGTIARLKLDGAAMDAVQGERTSLALLEFLLAANSVMPCSHLGITKFDAAIDQAAAALRADANAATFRRSPTCNAAELTAAITSYGGARSLVRGERCVGVWGLARRTDVDNGQMLFKIVNGRWMQVAGLADPYSSCYFLRYGVSREEAFALDDGYPRDQVCGSEGPFLIRGVWHFAGLTANFGNAGEPPRYRPEGYVYVTTDNSNYCLGSFGFTNERPPGILKWNCPDKGAVGSATFRFANDDMVLTFADGRTLVGRYKGP